MAGVTFAMLPLTHLLDYESSLLGAAVHGFLLAPTVVVLARRLGRAPLFFLPQMLLLAMLLQAPMFLILLVHTAMNCPFGLSTGLFFWFMYPVLTGVFTVALFLSLAQLRPTRGMVAVAALVPWISLIWALIRLLTEPPVFMFDPFFGFFSGAFYDRLIEVKPAFFAARTQHLAFALAPVAFVAWRAGMFPRRIGAALPAGLGALALALYVFSPTFAIRFPRAALIDRMGHEMVTEHFRFVYSQSDEENRIRMLAAEAEWHHTELVKFFGKGPSSRTTVFFFTNGDEKRLLFGTRDVEVAKPWQGSVFITSNGFPHPSLRHELAHVYATVWGDSRFGVAWSRSFSIGPVPVVLPDPGLIEGVAVAADGLQEDEDLHAQARLLMEMGGFVPLDVLFSLRFYGVSSSRAYVQAGSFLRYVVETRGAAPVRRLYAGGGPISRVLPDVAGVEREYREFLKTVPIPEHQRAMARERFSRPPVHLQRCVHSVARSRQRAVECVRAGDFDGAQRELEQALKMDPESLETWMLKLWAARQAQGPAAAQSAADRVLALSGEATHLQVRARQVKAEAAWIAGDVPGAVAHLDAAAAVLSPPAVQREIRLIRELMAMPRGAWPILQTIFTGPLPYWFWRGSFLPLTGQSALFSYLVAGADLNAGLWRQAATRYASLAFDRLPDDNFVCEARARHFLALLLTRRLGEARAALEIYSGCPVQERSVDYYRGFIAFLEANPGLSWDSDPVVTW
ncbi:MAG: hypothetical protein CVU59_08140 [Deltaproteobacteria bacterium HGW-Deltaproteobacteria-17]|nr:MAG: hypothetical protein CVU59_08140 [Deltaproteobacteria bacterium HGW-Deltaproteobacteria-17]